MATFQKRGDKVRAIVRRKGQPTTTRSFPNKTQAQRWARQVEEKMDRHDWHDPSLLTDWTVGQLIKTYRESVDLGNSEKSCLNNIDRYCHDYSLATFDSIKIMQYIRDRAGIEEAKPATIQMDIIFMQKILKYANSHLNIPARIKEVNKARDIMRPQGLIGSPEERIRRPTQDELDQLKEYYTSPNYRRLAKNDMWGLIEFAIASTFRLGEICRIRWDDFDDVKQTILIRDRKHPVKLRDTIVPLVGDAFTILVNREETDELIFPINKRSVSSTFPRHCQKLGIVDLRFHDFRHEGISRLFEHGLDIAQVATISGHLDWKSLKRYVQLKPESIIAKYNKLAD